MGALHTPERAAATVRRALWLHRRFRERAAESKSSRTAAQLLSLSERCHAVCHSASDRQRAAIARTEAAQ
jgi:hypothetical protein